MRKQERQKVKLNIGSTMVEVLVGFTMLSIFMAGLFQIIRVSSNMSMNAIDLQKTVSAFQEQYYKISHGTLEHQIVIPSTSNAISLVEADENRNKVTGGEVIMLDHAQVEYYRDNSTDYSIFSVTFQE